MFPAAETGFDPAGVHDLYSGNDRAEAIFETLLTYDYLARPAKLVPLTAEALPQVTDGGKTYTFKLRKGIYFTDRSGVQGQAARADRRTTTPIRSSASSIRRSARRRRSCSKARSSASTSSPRQAKKTGKFDYDAKIAGLEAPDRYTLRIRLKDPDYNFPHVARARADSARSRAR